FITQRLLASGDRFFVATELIVSGADVVPCFGVIWPQLEGGPGCCDRFRVTSLTVILKAEVEVILRSLRCRLIDGLSIRSRKKIARGQIARAQLQCALQESACLINARVEKQ